MASPFRFFRRYTKVFLAVAAVLAIFIFVVGDALMSRGSGGFQQDAGATVVTWKGGSLNQGQLASLVQQRLIVDEFLRRVLGQAGATSQYDIPQHIPNLLLRSNRIEYVEQQVINTEIVADLARDAGFTVSDAMINHYIEEWGLNKVGQDEIEGILRNVGQGNVRQNVAFVFNALRKMLLENFYFGMYGDAAQVVLPQERWDDWRKVNERISLQVAALPVEKLLPEVPEPSEAEVLAFYNDLKEADARNYEAVGDRERPRVAQPRKVRLQYLLGSVAQRAEQLAGTITDDQIAKYYEEKKDEFINTDLPGFDDSSEESEPTETPATPADAETPPAEATEPAAQPADETTPAAELGAAEPSATPPEKAATEPAAEPAGQPAETTPADGTDDSSSNSPPTSPFRLAAFQAPPAESADDGDDDDDESAEPAEEAPADEATSVETPAAPTDSAAPPTADTAAEPAAAATEPKLEYEPLDKVRDEIRRQLATEKAETELKRTMSAATAELQSEYNRYASALLAARDAEKQPPKPPAKLTDLTWLAEKHGLTYEKTAPLSLGELFDTIVGKALSASNQNVNVTVAAFTSLELYEPFLAQEIENDWYLVTKLEDMPRRVPALKEVRDEVVKKWKLAEAAKLAEKKADELADQAEKASVPFDQFFADKGFEVIKQTSFFSWYSYPLGQAGMGTPPMLSEVPELKNVDSQFMEAAFGLEGNKTVGLLNADRSVAYVIRLNRRQWSEEELKKLFLEEEASSPIRRDMFMARASGFLRMLENEILEDRAGREFDEEWLEERRKRLAEQMN